MAHAESLQDMDDRQLKKIFVGGLSWDTTESTFSNYFSKYGEIKDSIVMKDRLTGRSRGFGFITFADVKSFHALLKDRDTLEIDGRKVEVKDAVPQEQQNRAQAAGRTKKIFVGGLHTDTTEEEFKQHFAAFGEVVEASIMVDADSQRSRGFGFITFVSEDTVDLVLSQSHTITGRPVDCKPAVPKKQMPPRNDFGPPSRGGPPGGYYRGPGGMAAGGYYDHPYARGPPQPRGGRGGRGYGGAPYGGGYGDAAWAHPSAGAYRSRAVYDSYAGGYEQAGYDGASRAAAPAAAATGAVYDYGGGGYQATPGYGQYYDAQAGYGVQAAQGTYAGYSQESAYASSAGGATAAVGGYAPQRSERPSRGYSPYSRGPR